LEWSGEDASLDAKACRWDRGMRKRCAYCGKEIEEDFRLGLYDGPWFCSQECEQHWIEEKEKREDEEDDWDVLLPLWMII